MCLHSPCGWVVCVVQMCLYDCAAALALTHICAWCLALCNVSGTVGHRGVMSRTIGLRGVVGIAQYLQCIYLFY